jgi:hypothetical protein
MTRHGVILSLLTAYVEVVVAADVPPGGLGDTVDLFRTAEGCAVRCPFED